MKRHQLAGLAKAIALCAITHSAWAQTFPGQEEPASSQAASDKGKAADEALSALGLDVGDGRSRSNRPPGHYVVFEKSGSGWKVGNISNTPNPVSDFADREVLYFSKDLNYVDPDFRDFQINRKSGQFECMTGALRNKQANHTAAYNPCQSSLTSTVDAKLGSQAVLAVASFGLSLLTGTTVREVAVDKAAVLALLQKTDVLDRLKERNATEERQAYLEAYQKAKSAAALTAFINRYANNDPEGLVPKAIEQREQAKGNEYRRAFENANSTAALDAFIQRYQGNDPDNLIPKAMERRKMALAEEQKAAQIEAGKAAYRQLVEAGRQQERLAAMKKPGTKVCITLNGSRDVYAGFTVYGVPQMRPVNGVYTVIGFTEGFSGNRIQIRTSSIRHVSQAGESFYMDALTNTDSGIRMQTGQLFWDDIGNWTPC